MDVLVAQTVINVRHADLNLSLIQKQVLVMNFVEMEENSFIDVMMAIMLTEMDVVVIVKFKLDILVLVDLPMDQIIALILYLLESQSSRLVRSVFLQVLS